MIEFMREGGFGMWLTLAFFLAAAVATVVRRHRDGERWAFGGAIAVLASGLLGMSTGIYMTVAHAAGDPEILAIGMRESVNNTVFAAVLAIVVAFLGVAFARRERRAAPAA